MAEVSDAWEKDYQEQIKMGMDVLDKVQPEWVEDIDLERLDIGSDFSCVLGQLYGTYASGVRNILGLTIEECIVSGRPREWSIEHGFFSPACDGDKDELTREWKDAIIEERRKLVGK